MLILTMQSGDGPDVEKARNYFSNMEFHSLLGRLDRFEKGIAPSQMPAAGSLLDAYEAVDSEERLKALAGRIIDSGCVSVYAGMSDIDTQVTRGFLWPDTLGISAGDRPCLIDFGCQGLMDPDSYQEYYVETPWPCCCGTQR